MHALLMGEAASVLASYKNIALPKSVYFLNFLPFDPIFSSLFYLVLALFCRLCVDYMFLGNLVGITLVSQPNEIVLYISSKTQLSTKVY